MHATPMLPSRLERLPDFCSPPIVFAMLLAAALTVAVMALAPGAPFHWNNFTTAMAFAVWLAVVNAVALCKCRPLFMRMPGLWAFAGVWLVIVVIVLAASIVVGWLDHALATGLTGTSTFHFALACTATSALIGAALLRYFHVVAQWQARTAAGTHAKFQALQARIQPHFLFNSMNTVAALVRVNPQAAETTIENLSELFRAALGAEDMGTLGGELALVDRYLGIEGWRLAERLKVERDLEGLPLSLPLPRLLLQPLAENAVRHGIQPRRDGGTIRLAGRVEGDAVVLRITNPLPPPGASTSGSGQGLDNVRQRLAYHFGPRAHLDSRRHDGCFIVQLSIPFAMARDPVRPVHTPSSGAEHADTDR